MYSKHTISLCTDDIYFTFTQGDIGSPLTKVISELGENTKYIVGVTIRRFKSEKETFLRFIRINVVTEDIQNMLYKLESKTAEDEDYVGSIYQNLKNVSNKCPNYQQLYQK